jgi:hypothetical protein
MGKVTSEICMWLDGFITGPNVGVGNGMGGRPRSTFRLVVRR